MKKDDKDTQTQELSEHTASLTGSDIQEALAKLLGEKDLARPAETRALLRLASGNLSEKLAEKLKLSTTAQTEVFNGDAVPLILGPFSIESLRTCALGGLLSQQDYIQSAYDRWKAPKIIFPGIASGFGPIDELTATATVERTGSLSTDFSALEVDALDDGPLEGPALGQKLPGDARDKMPVVPARSSQMGIPADSQMAKELPRSVRVSIDNTEMQSTPSPRRTRSAASSSVSLGVACLVALVVGVSAFKFYQARHRSDRALPGLSESASTANETKSLNWPAALKPQPTEALYVDESPLVRRLRPILLAYERGATVLSAGDEQILKALADPASASWEARRLAANQLTVFYLAKMRLEDARRTLQPILEATPNDPTTLLNDALLRLAEGDPEGAKQAASVGTRLSPPGTMWVAYAISGIIQGAQGRTEEAERQFESALSHSSNNPFIYGMWIQSLSKSEAGRKRIPALIREALFSDPDRLTDSPIRAPLAGHILMAEALSGFKKAVDLPNSGLSSGQSSFVRWLDARASLNPLGESIGNVSGMLASEATPQSQLLYAYLLKEQSKVDEASEILSQAIPLLEGQKISSSWPWSFAGDIQTSRRQMNQSLIYYQSALSRNSLDAAAVLGLAVALREAGDYQGAEQKFAESLALDPLLIPALLRIDRFEWHRRTRAQ